VTARVFADDEAGRAEAVATVRRGGIVAMPTDTVYGVGVALDAPDGLARLFAAKDRPLDRAIVLLVADIEQAETVGLMTASARTLAERFWPGGLTLVLAQTTDARLPAALTAGNSTIGVRVPDHDCPRAMARELGPLPVTSANISGQPPATTAAEVVEQLGERIDLILDGGPARGGTPSTVVDCSGDEPKVLRMGAISAGLLVGALEDELGSGSENVWAGKARAVAVVGLDAAVEAASRLLDQAAATKEWESPDFWAYDLGRVLGSADPELGWAFVCRLVEVVSDRARPLAGAGELEDFCWVAGSAFIDRIEAQARSSTAFREALAEVWPGGETVPAEVYARIRKASEAV
jgi:L-threonylcarbamoyladenylate synthase